MRTPERRPTGKTTRSVTGPAGPSRRSGALGKSTIWGMSWRPLGESSGTYNLPFRTRGPEVILRKPNLLKPSLLKPRLSKPQPPKLSLPKPSLPRPRR